MKPDGLNIPWPDPVKVDWRERAAARSIHYSLSGTVKMVLGSDVTRVKALRPADYLESAEVADRKNRRGE